MRYEFCSEEEFRQRAYDYLTERIAVREGMTVEEVRRLVPLQLIDGYRGSSGPEVESE